MRRGALKRNFVLNVIYQALVVLVPLFTMPYLSRILGPTNMGIKSFTSSLMTYFSLFAVLGTASYGAREIARARDDKESMSRLFWQIEILTLITSGIALAIWGFVIYFNPNYRIYFIILTIELFSAAFNIFWFYAGQEEFEKIIIANGLVKIVTLVLTFVLVRNEHDLWKYMLVSSGTILLANLSGWVFLPKKLTKVRLGGLNLRHHLKETIIYFIPAIASTAFMVVDKTLIGFLIPQTETVIVDGKETLVRYSELENGYYESGSAILTMAISVTCIALNNILSPRLSYLYKKEEFESAQRLLDISIDYSIFMGVGICLGVCGTAAQFVPAFFGSGYEKVITLLYLFGPIAFAQSISACIGSQYYNPIGERAKSARLLIYGALLNTVLNIILIYYFWSIGAVIASLISEFFVTILYIIFSKRHVTFYGIWSKLWKKLIAGAVLFAMAYSCGFLPVNIYARLVIQVLAGLCGYVAVSLLLKDSFVYGVCWIGFVGWVKRRRMGGGYEK